MTEYEDLQSQIRNRSYKIGWYKIGCPKEKHYFDQKFNSWHEAASFQADLFKTLGDPNAVLFIEPLPEAGARSRDWTP